MLAALVVGLLLLAAGFVGCESFTFSNVAASLTTCSLTESHKLSCRERQTERQRLRQTVTLTQRLLQRHQRSPLSLLLLWGSFHSTGRQQAPRTPKDDAMINERITFPEVRVSLTTNKKRDHAPSNNTSTADEVNSNEINMGNNNDSSSSDHHQDGVDDSSDDEADDADDLVQVDIPLGVMSIQQALAEANARSLDLVLINANTAPPLCKIVDYGRYKYSLARKKRDQKKSQRAKSLLKEIKLSYKIDTHDIEVRYKAARAFLEGGDRVKVMLHLDGREMQFQDNVAQILNQFISKLLPIATVDDQAKMEGRSMYAILSPKRVDKRPKSTQDSNDKS